MANSTDNGRSLVGLGFELSTLAAAAFVVAAVALDALRLPIRPWSAGILALVLVLPVFVVSWRQSRARPLKIDWQTDLLLLGITGVVAWRLFSLAWPDLLPIGYSVDAVHHTALANYIFERQQLVRDPAALSTHLGEMVDYPPGFTVLAALVAAGLGLLPVQVIYPLAALAVVAGVLGVALLAVHSVPSPIRPLAALAPLALLLIPDYILGTVASETYYPQAMAQWLIVAVGVVVVRQAPRVALCRWALLAFFLLALAFTYTTWLPVALLTVFLGLFAQREPWRRRLLYGAAVLVPVGAIALAFGLAHRSTGISVVQHEGNTIRDPLGVTGIWLPCLALAGLVFAWRSSARRAALALIAAAVLHTVGLWLLWQRGQIAGYIYYKSYYLLALLLPVPLGWLLADAGAILTRRWPAWGRALALAQATLLVAAASFAAIMAGLPALSEPPARPLSPAVLEAAHWIRTHGKPDDVALALQAPGLSAYWLHVGVLSRPRTQAAHALLTAPRIGFWEWYLQPSMPRMLLLEQSTLPDTRAGLDVRFRSACCMVLEKQAGAAYETAVQRSRPLIVDYRVAPFEQQQHVDVRVFDPASQPDLHVRLLLQASERTLVAHTLPVPQRPENQEHLEFVIDPETLAATGFVEGEPETVLPAPEIDVPPGYHARLQLLHRDVVVAERSLGQCCEATGHWIVPQPSGKWIWFVPPRVHTALQPHVFTLGEAITLEGSRIDPPVVRPGESLAIRLRWHAAQAIGRRYIMFVQLIAPDGGAALSVESEPNDGVTPTWRWQAGDRVDETWQVKLPPDLPPGTYPVVVGMYDPVAGKRLEAWRRQPYLERFWTDALPLGNVEVR